MRTVRPDTVRNDRTIPGAGINHGDQGDDTQQTKELAIQPVMAGDEDQSQGSHEKNQQELPVTHLPTAPASTSPAQRMANGYRCGVVAAVLAAVIASAIATVAAWPSPLEATA